MTGYMVTALRTIQPHHSGEGSVRVSKQEVLCRPMLKQERDYAVLVISESPVHARNI
jgi:hypothetical protein